MIMRLLIFSTLVLLLVGCGSAPAAAPTAAPVLDAQTQAVVNELQGRLASTIGVEATNLSLVSAQPTTWNDSSLGCATGNSAALQVIIEGYLLIFSDGSRTYEVHAGGPGGPALICENGQPQRINP
jgi:hypothetical protein